MAKFLPKDLHVDRLLEQLKMATYPWQQQLFKSRAGMVLLNCSQSDEALQAQLSGAKPARPGRSMDLRNYGIGAQILRDLGVGRMRLMATPRKMPSMAGFGLEICGYAERTPG